MSATYVTTIEGANPGWRYGSGLAVYTERFIDGRLLSSSYVDNGIPVFEIHENTDLPSFDLVIDGESLYYNWEVEGFETSSKEGKQEGILTLKHSLKPVTLKIITTCCGYGFFKRKIQITNTSKDQSLGLTSIIPLQGMLWRVEDSVKEILRDNTVIPYSVGHLKDFHWGQEGNFGWQDVPLNTEVSYSSTLGKSGHSNPFFILKNNIYGGYFVCHLAWSANWKTSFFTDYTKRTRMRFSVAPVTPAPMRIIAPGETISAPEVHFGLSHDSFDTAIQNLHSHLRESVLKKVGDGLQPVIYNHWGYLEHEISEEALKAEIDIAAEVGAELFVVDAGWYGDKDTDWWNYTGDWQAGDRLPNDLFPVFDYAHSKGLKCGLWVELESAACKSRLAQEHPDWLLSRYGNKDERHLDLSKPEVVQHIESEAIRIIERYKLDMFRLDYNSNQYEGGFNLVDGRMENTLWRQMEAVYSLWERISRRFPNLQLETCAAGGGRTDIGIVSRFTTTWVTDWNRLPRGIRILNGMSMVLPPEYVSRLTGIAMGNDRGNLDTQMHSIILAHPAVSGLTPKLAEANPEMLECVKRYIDIYKNFIRPFHRESIVYHHTLEIPGIDGTGWCALEYVSKDRQKAVAAVFRLMDAEEDVYRFKFRGLNPGLNYQITFEPGGWGASYSGADLFREGIEVRLDNPLTSLMMLVKAK